MNQNGIASYKRVLKQTNRKLAAIETDGQETSGYGNKRTGKLASMEPDESETTAIQYEKDCHTYVRQSFKFLMEGTGLEPATFHTSSECSPS